MPTINRKQKSIKQVPYRHENNVSSRYYNDIRWKRLRNWFISNNPLCAECAKKGIVTPATEVHHIIPFLSAVDESVRWDLLLDVDNLLSLCNKCHHNIHKKLKL